MQNHFSAGSPLMSYNLLSIWSFLNLTSSWFEISNPIEEVAIYTTQMYSSVISYKLSLQKSNQSNGLTRETGVDCVSEQPAHEPCVFVWWTWFGVLHLTGPKSVSVVFASLRSNETLLVRLSRYVTLLCTYLWVLVIWKWIDLLFYQIHTITDVSLAIMERFLPMVSVFELIRKTKADRTSCVTRSQPPFLVKL